MNKFVTFLCIFILASSAIFAQYTWQLKMSGGGRGNPIAIDPVDNNIVYYGSSSAVFKSTDRGETFSQYGSTIPGSSAIKCLHVHPKRPGEMVVSVHKGGSSYKVVKSTDFGATWITTADNLSFSFYGIPSTQDPTHPDTLYLMNGNNFDRSIDFGSTWATLTSSVGTLTAPCDIIVFPDTSIILVGDNGTGIFKSTNYGMTWSQTYSTSGEIPTIAVDHNMLGTAWATKFAGGGGIIRTTNYGDSWVTVAYSGTSTWGVHIHPDDPNYVVTGTWSGSNVYITRDWGTTWLHTTLPASNYAVAVIDSINVFAAQSGGFYKLWSPNFIPVELTSFNATVQDNRVVLEWTTATETNNYGFEIESGFDNQEFETIAFVPGYGTTAESKSYSYTIDELITQKTYFRLKQMDYDGSFKYYDAVKVDAVIPTLYEVTQNFPNPFNPSTAITFTLPVDANVTISVFNSIGEQVGDITNSQFTPGIHTVNFNADNLSSGIYFYRMQANGTDGSSFSSVKKMILIK